LLAFSSSSSALSCIFFIIFCSFLNRRIHSLRR
jgi:hypothetical protein